MKYLRNPAASSSCHHAGAAYEADEYNVIAVQDEVDTFLLRRLGFEEFATHPVQTQESPEEEVPVSPETPAEEPGVVEEPAAPEKAKVRRGRKSNNAG